MTEEEFNEKVKAIADERQIPEVFAEYIVIREFLQSDSSFKIADHLVRIEEYEYRNIKIPPERYVFRPSIYAAVSEPMPNKKIMGLKLYIFDYFHNLKPGLVFASNEEEAVKLIKERGVTGLPDRFYSTVKEIEIPTHSTYVRYATGE